MTQYHGFWGVIFSICCAGCIIEVKDCPCEDDPPCNRYGTDSDDTGTGVTNTRVGGGSGTSEGGTLPFTPTHLDGIEIEDLTGDLVFSDDGILNFQDNHEAWGDEGAEYTYQEVTQSDGSRLGVFAARNIRIEATATVSARGSIPLALVALETMYIGGTLDFGADDSGTYAGGYESPEVTDTNKDGNGPGGGTAGSEAHSGGGGSYCGGGGMDGNEEGNGGAVYGNEILSPLMGGSSGGSVFAGAGGGAVQLVAGTSIRISATGQVTAGGGAGDYGGGGSGGAILIESPEVTIDGVVAANGGGGGGKGGGAENGMASDQPASGASDADHTADGGGGSAGNEIDGSDGGCDTYPTEPCFITGTGGGGAGRIRINTDSGAAAINGIVSPEVGTGCATLGRI